MKTAIVSFETFSDGSGAPAVIAAGGLRWRFDMLGEVKFERLGAGSGFVARGLVKASRASAEVAYRGELSRRVSAEWFVANTAMYANEGQVRA